MTGLAFDGTGRATYPGVDQAGAYTRLFLAQLTGPDGNWNAMLSGETSGNVGNWTSERAGSGGFWLANSLTNSRVVTGVFDMVWSDPLLWLAGDGIVLIVEGKVAGGGTPLPVSKFIWTGSAWAHAANSPDTMDPQLASGDPLGPGGIVSLGAYQTTDDHFVGNVWAAALWDGVLLSQAQINALAAAPSTANALALAPTALWDWGDGLNADRTGNGHDRLSLSGATATAPALPAGAWTVAGGGGGGGGGSAGLMMALRGVG